MSIVSKSNKNFINDNWGKLKCSPIGPFIQMIGLAPGDPTKTSQDCKSSEFNAQFGSSMFSTNKLTSKLGFNINLITDQLQSFRKIISTIQQEAFKDLSQVAGRLVDIYAKIGKLFFILIKHLKNILRIFKESVNLGAGVTKLTIAFINLLRNPINRLMKLMGRKR